MHRQSTVDYSAVSGNIQAACLNQQASVLDCQASRERDSTGDVNPSIKHDQTMLNLEATLDDGAILVNHKTTCTNIQTTLDTEAIFEACATRDGQAALSDVKTAR